MERSNLIAEITEDKTHAQNIKIPHIIEFYFHTWFGTLEHQNDVTMLKLRRYE